MFCFDKNYVIPAAVAFYSLLENNEKGALGGGVEFRLYVVHNNIPLEYQNKLHETIKPFNHFAKLEFMDAKNDLDWAWKKINDKNHFALEVLYKLRVSSLFPNYQKIIISDVDVVFLGNIIEGFKDFDTNQEYLIGGVVSNNPQDFFPIPTTGFAKGYRKYSPQELKAIQHGCGGGYLIANLEQWRKKEIEKKFTNILFEKAEKLVLAEQDVLNLSCYPYIKKIHPAHIVAHDSWRTLGDNFQKLKPNIYTQAEIQEMCNNPIQLHYVGASKPWNTPSVPKSEIWYIYLCKTPFLRIFLDSFEQNILNHLKKKSLIYKIKKYAKNPKIFLKKILRKIN